MTSETINASSEQCERLVLGAMLNSFDNAEIALKKLQDDDFHDNNHKTILNAIKYVYEEKKLVDIQLVATRLDADDNLKSVGGFPYLIDLVNGAGTSLHVAAYCEDLRALTTERQLISLSNSLVNDIKQRADAWKVVDKLKDRIKQIEEQKHKADSAYSFLLEKNSRAKLIEELRNISPGISTGFTIGDVELKIPGGAISIIAAPTSHGKTTALINIALGALKHQHDKSIYFFSYEESSSSILSLFLNTWIGKEISKNNRESIISYFRNGNMEFIKTDFRPEFQSSVDYFFSEIIDKGRLIVNYSEMTIEELIRAIYFIKENSNAGLICIDYVQLLRMMKPTGGSRQEELKQICLMLKNCAVDTGLPILLAAQFNRTVVKEADLSPTNIREAGDIEQIANLVIGMWNRNFEGFSQEGNVGRNKKIIPKESAIYFEILKGRGIGNGHNCVMNFDGNSGKIENRTNNPKTTTSPIGHKGY